MSVNRVEFKLAFLNSFVNRADGIPHSCKDSSECAQHLKEPHPRAQLSSNLDRDCIKHLQIWLVPRLTMECAKSDNGLVGASKKL